MCKVFIIYNALKVQINSIQKAVIAVMWKEKLSK